MRNVISSILQFPCSERRAAVRTKPIMTDVDLLCVFRRLAKNGIDR